MCLVWEAQWSGESRESSYQQSVPTFGRALLKKKKKVNYSAFRKSP